MNVAETLTLLACQIDIPPMTTAAERDAHLAQSTAKIRAEIRQSDRKVDLVVLPELSSIDYARKTFAELSEIAETLQGASYQAWRDVATEFGVFVSYSFARKGEHGNHICVAVVGSDGELVTYYDKLHLAQYGASMEKEYFKAGNHISVFELKGFRLAPIICYDIRIPELSRTLVIDHEVDAILHCGAYYRDTSFHTWHPFAITRALENQVFFLSLNRAGENYGNSLFCPPWQDESTPPTRFAQTAEEFRVITLDHATLCCAREEYTFLQDRLNSYGLDIK